LIERLRATFEVEKVILIPWDTLEEYGHADGMLRFIDDTTVLINEIYKSDKKMLGLLQQNGIKWEWLQYTVKKKDKKRWSYINFLQTKDFILLPKYGIDEDEQALEQIKSHFSDYVNNGRIAQVDMTEIVSYGGALNCISWTKKS
jgi:agmatine deiminase